MPKRTIICFGEVLWDLLPTGKIAGGAPMNVAFHLNNFGFRSKMISRIGDDSLGRELLVFLKDKGVSTALVQTGPAFPTGTVNVALDEKGSPSYEIVQPVAWDFIHPDDAAKQAVKKADALVFGSLACRNGRTKNTLLELLGLAALKVFDVNLRQPFYSKELLEELLPQANIVKMNDEEVQTISAWYGGATGDETDKMFFLKKRFGFEALIVTKGPHGAALLNGAGLFTQSGFPVKVQDTIGSGDSFLAAFLKKMLTGAPEQECLRFACATGALVASKKGGTPVISEEDVHAFIA